MKHVKIKPLSVVNFTQIEDCFTLVHHVLHVFSRYVYLDQNL